MADKFALSSCALTFSCKHSIGEPRPLLSESGCEEGCLKPQPWTSSKYQCWTTFISSKVLLGRCQNGSGSSRSGHDAFQICL